MRISTSQIHRQGTQAILARQAEAAKAQQQLSSGKRILSPSDDPIASARLLSLHEQSAATEQYQRNLSLATGRLSLEETALEQAGNVLQQVRELTVQANTDTLSDSDRNAIAKKVRQLHAQLVGVANTKDGNGEYLFAGFKTHTEPFVLDGSASGGVNYQGDDGQRLVQVGPSLQIAIGDSGAEVFQKIQSSSGSNQGIFTTLDKLADALETSSTTPTANAQLHQSLDDALTDLDYGLDHFSMVNAQVGARLAALDSQDQANQDFQLHLQETISAIGDLDYAEAATRLSEGLITLQAAQQSFLRIQNLSLFNFIK